MVHQGTLSCFLSWQHSCFLPFGQSCQHSYRLFLIEIPMPHRLQYFQPFRQNKVTHPNVVNGHWAFTPNCESHDNFPRRSHFQDMGHLVNGWNHTAESRRGDQESSFNLQERFPVIFDDYGEKLWFAGRKQKPLSRPSNQLRLLFVFRDPYLLVTSSLIRGVIQESASEYWINLLPPIKLDQQRGFCDLIPSKCNSHDQVFRFLNFPFPRGALSTRGTPKMLWKQPSFFLAFSIWKHESLFWCASTGFSRIYHWQICRSTFLRNVHLRIHQSQDVPIAVRMWWMFCDITWRRTRPLLQNAHLRFSAHNIEPALCTRMRSFLRSFQFIRRPSWQKCRGRSRGRVSRISW